MNYYFSGIGDGTGKYIKFATSFVTHRLLSCHGPYVSFAHRWLKDTLELGCGKSQTILLDSGAFTAWNQGHPTTLDALLPVYSDFIKKYLDHVENIWLINLDKIPGTPGTDPTQVEIAEAIHESDENYRVLVDTFGPRVLPVFHQGESNARLFEVDAMSEYVCISPRNDVGERHRVAWSREVHEVLPAGKMTHGLATTGFLMMTTVPWFSVDSAAWVSVCSYGGVIVLLGDTMHILGVTPESPTRFKLEAHFDTLNEHSRAVVLDRLHQIDMTPEHVANFLSARLVFTMNEIQKWVDTKCRVDHKLMPNLWDL
jgi:hypothetical protein